MMEEQAVLKSLSKPVETIPINIEFENLSYSVTNIKETKNILHSLCGNFRSGELTGILGASGSGKTTLIKILVGYIANDTSDNIKINNTPKHINYFRKSSVFIMQEDLFQPLLTVHEAMMVSANLKLGNFIGSQRRRIIVEEILQNLGLEDCLKIRVENLSGGQRKRLSIALELVDNPPVVFLDEPTSGLDFVSAKQCIKLLRNLADQGKTVICTIHQPSVSIFDNFDQTYFIADGRCVYNGSPSNMLSFLESVRLPCPLDYSPAEYVIEVVQMNPESVPILSKAIQNGQLNYRSTISLIGREAIDTESEKTMTYKSRNYFLGFWAQFFILMKRMWLQQRRNQVSLLIVFVEHVAVSILISILFREFGNNAVFAIRNFMYFLCMITFFVYNYSMPSTLIMPTEIKILKREYFNRWYCLEAYYLALALRTLPVMLILGFQIIAVTYVFTSQPLEADRFIWFYISNMLMAMISEAFGLIIGSIFNVKHGAGIGPSSFMAFLSLAIYGMDHGHILLFWKILRYTSYIRYGLVATTLAMLKDRPMLDCSEIFCEMADTKLFLREVGMLHESFYVQVVGLFISLLFYRTLGFFVLKLRLNKVLFNKTISYVFRIVNRRR